MIKQIETSIFGFLIFLFISNILVWIVVFDLAQFRFLEVNFLNVGQGDAILIETPQRHQILIDGGPDSTILEKLGNEMPFWDRSIDLVVLTHPERDHISGLIEVLKRYKVNYILWTGVLRDTAEYKEWLRAVEKEVREGADIKIAQAGQRIILWKSDLHNLWKSDLHNYMEVLFPFEDLEGKEYKNSNNTSIVARLVFDQNSFLFTGDAYKSVERKLIENQFHLGSDVLKVGHHGSKTSNSKEFIEAVSPEVAVISVGKDNRYGHPHQDTLENLAGIKILRTDLDGDIKIITDGTSLKIRN